MIHKLSDYVDIKKFKSGNYCISCSVSQEVNICKLLANMNYRRKHNGVRYYYVLLSDNAEQIVELSDIRSAFISFLKTTQFDKALTELERQIIINWFWEKKNRVRENDLFKHYLNPTE